MRAVAIPVHPLSARVLAYEYGSGSIVMNNHDPLFTFITCSPLRTRISRGSDLLDSQVIFHVNDELALHLQQYDWQVGAALLRMHKRELCQFAAAAVALGHKGGAKDALYLWLNMRGITEDEYSLETAYKLWQRFGWKLSTEKSATYFAQIRGKAADSLRKKRNAVPKQIKPFNSTSLTLSQIEVELAANRFVSALKKCFRRAPAKMAYHARIYYYATYAGIKSNRDVARTLGIPASTINYAVRSIKSQASKNITMGRLLADALPDSEDKPAPSGHVRHITCYPKAMPCNTRVNKGYSPHRSNGSGQSTRLAFGT
jgi:hypothetical protein